MRVRAVTPILVDEDELARRQSRYERFVPPSWTIELENLPAGERSPKRLDTQAEIRDSEATILRLTEESPNDEAIWLLDCVLDPAVPDIRQTVLGLTRLSSHFLAGLGHRFGVITRNEAIGAEYRAVVERYGLGGLFDQVYVLGLSVEDIARDDVWNAAIEGAAAQALANGTRVLVNGCSAVEVTVAQGAVRIIDPTSLALKVAGLASELDLIDLGGAR